MKKLSLKWKLFLIFSYLQLVVFLCALTLIVIPLFNKNSSTFVRFPLQISLLLLGLILVALNNFLCIYAVHRYFPSALIPRANKRLMRVIAIIAAALWFGLMVLCLIGWQSEFLTNDPFSDRTSLIALIVASVIWLMGLFTLILQLELPVLLNRNNSVEMRNMIDSIGTNS